MKTEPSGVILGAKGGHPLHREVRVVLLGDAFIVPSPLLSIRRRRDDQAYRLIFQALGSGRGNRREGRDRHVS